MKNTSLFFVLCLVINVTFGQTKNHFIDLSTGFNRIGFYNELGYKFEINSHQLKIGARHYTLDNFFEKNTVGASLAYSYLVRGTSNKFYFYPGINISFFNENKNNANVILSEYKLVNGFGYNFNKRWSLSYQLGFGVILTKSHLPNFEEPIRLEYFNYELAVGLSYKIFTKQDN
jgi:hypothetical protein